MLCTYSDMCHIFSFVWFFSMQSDFKWTKSDKQSWILKWQAILKCYSWLHLSPLNKKMKTVLDDVQIAILSLAVKTSLFFHTLLCKISSEWWIISSSKLTPIFNSNEIAIFKQWYGTDLETKKNTISFSSRFFFLSDDEDGRWRSIDFHVYQITVIEG